MSSGVVSGGGWDMMTDDSRANGSEEGNEGRGTWTSPEQ